MHKSCTIVFIVAVATIATAQEVTEQQCNGRPTLTCHLIPTLSQTLEDEPSNVRGGILLSPFWRDGCFTRAAGYVSGLGAATPHGYHIHELGDISASEGSSTGNHYNPFGNDHALPSQGERSTFHVGDLGNLFPNEEGIAQFDTLYQDP